MGTERLREASYLILVALASGERHGYGIVREVEGISGGRVRLGTGTLYGALERLQDDGLVVVAREETVDGRVRRYYRLSAHGRSVLIAEVERFEANARVGRLRLKGAT